MFKYLQLPRTAQLKTLWVTYWLLESLPISVSSRSLHVSFMTRTPRLLSKIIWFNQNTPILVLQEERFSIWCYLSLVKDFWNQKPSMVNKETFTPKWLYLYLSFTEKKLTDFDHYSERTLDVLDQREKTWYDQQEDKGKDVHPYKDKKETKTNYYL